MEIFLNGKKKEIGETENLRQFIDSLNLGNRRVVVELNESVIKKDDFGNTDLKPEDRLEILHFVGGGEK